jgi:hypothetical protein
MTFHATGTVSGTAAELGPLMASENEALAELKAEGLVTRALLSADRAQVFLVVEGADEDAVRRTLSRLPLVGPGHLRFALEPVVAI